MDVDERIAKANIPSNVMNVITYCIFVLYFMESNFCGFLISYFRGVVVFAILWNYKIKNYEKDHAMYCVLSVDNINVGYVL